MISPKELGIAIEVIVDYLTDKI